jgi:hypothetical protein
MLLGEKRQEPSSTSKFSYRLSQSDKLLFRAFDRPCWNTTDYGVGGYVSRDNSACRDYRAVTDGRASDDDCATANPDVITDPDGLRRRSAMAGCVNACSMPDSFEAYPRPYPTTLAYRDHGFCAKTDLGVKKRLSANAYVLARSQRPDGQGSINGAASLDAHAGHAVKQPAQLVAKG